MKTPEENIPSQVVGLVRQAILAGSLEPGRRLSERELSDLTGVSCTSIPGRQKESSREFMVIAMAIEKRCEAEAAEAS